MRFEETKPCPYYAWIDPAMVDALAGIYGSERFLGSAGGLITFDGSFTAMTEVKAQPVHDDGEYFEDEYGAKLRRGSILHLETPALGGPSLDGYTFPDMTTDIHFAHLDAWAQTHASRFRIVQVGKLFWERTWFMRGMQEIMMDFHTNPDFVEALFDGLVEICLGVIDKLLSDYGSRFDAIGFSEDYGTEISLMISPATWRRFIKPHLARLCERVRRGGKRFYLHSCGHVRPLIPDFVEIGVDMLQPLQPEAMDIFEIKRTFGHELCLVGGISTQQTLPFGTPEEVRSEVGKCLEHMATGGGYIMAPAKPILPGVPLENARALIDAFTEQA
jgi:uroporphyrinogen decarboxylase